MNKFSDLYIKNVHSFVRTSFDLQEMPLLLPIHSRRYQYKASVKLFVRSDKRKINFRNLFVQLARPPDIYICKIEKYRLRPSLDK